MSATQKLTRADVELGRERGHENDGKDTEDREGEEEELLAPVARCHVIATTATDAIESPKRAHQQG
ncbi:hypothetical protein HK405_014670, partial [Cladochytrium tenue]